MDSITIGILGFLVMLVCLLLGIHIGVALGLIGFVGLIALRGFTAAAGALATTGYTTISIYIFTLIPLFVLMGEFARIGGLSEKSYRVGQQWLGRFPGGLAMATIVGCAGFAAVCGSSAVTAAVFTRMSLQEMRSYGYDKSFACGAIAGGGTLGMLIPPSLLLILFGILTEVSIGRLLLSGVIPGFLLAGIFIVTIGIWTKLKPRLAPVVEMPTTWKHRLTSFKGIWGVVVIFLVVMGGIYGGVFTPTEAGAVGALVALIAMITARKFTWGDFAIAILEAARISGLMIFIIIGGVLFSRFLSISGVSFVFIDFVLSLSWSPIFILILFLVMYLFLGCFLDSTSCFVLTLPLVFPILTGLGYDPIWLGILITLIVEVGLLTPPLGMNVYMVQASAPPDVSVEDVFRGVTPFFFAMLIGVAFLVAFPILGTFLPYSMLPPL
ncbi:TRAP transporter large permease [Chloroflexota bacterium]